MSQQVDIAVDLGVVARPRPAIVRRPVLAAAAPMPPPQVIEGVLHQGCKMILGGTSKSNKTWCLLNLAASVASGAEWLGRRCARMPVLYLNFELHDWAVNQRVNAIESVRRECDGIDENLHFWNLRGHSADITLLRPMLEEEIVRYEFGLIVLDPVYKVLGDRDENANGEVAGLMNELEALVQSSGVAVVAELYREVFRLSISSSSGLILARSIFRLKSWPCLKNPEGVWETSPGSDTLVPSNLHRPSLATGLPITRSLASVDTSVSPPWESRAQGTTPSPPPRRRGGWG